MPFTSDWFSQHIPNWQQWLQPFVGRPVEALEIGSFEGRSALWLMENVLTHPEARLHCVDSYQFPEHYHGHIQTDAPTARLRFEDNLQQYRDRVCLHVARSQKALPELYSSPRFSVIYVDGSHTAADALTDLVLSWPLLLPGGVMIADDYQWPVKLGVHLSVAIDSFLATFADELEVLHKGYQVAMQRRSGQ